MIVRDLSLFMTYPWVELRVNTLTSLEMFVGNKKTNFQLCEAVYKYIFIPPGSQSKLTVDSLLQLAISMPIYV